MCGCVHVYITLDCSSFFHVCFWWVASPTFCSYCNILLFPTHYTFSPLSLLFTCYFPHFIIQPNQQSLTNQPFGFYLCLAPQQTVNDGLSLSSLSCIVQHRLIAELILRVFSKICFSLIPGPKFSEKKLFKNIHTMLTFL